MERSEPLKKDLEWFTEQGHTIPEPTAAGTAYASYLEELSEKDPQAFICHFYNVYFAHTAGGRMIGKKVRLCRNSLVPERSSESNSVFLNGSTYYCKTCVCC